METGLAIPGENREKREATRHQHPFGSGRSRQGWLRCRKVLTDEFCREEREASPEERVLFLAR